jgi:hypothetical protein
MLVSFFVLTAIANPGRAATADTDLLQKLARAGGLEKFPRANIIFVEKRRDIKYEEDGCVSSKLTEAAYSSN